MAEASLSGRIPRHAELKARQRALRDGFPPDMALKVHRAISWLGRAEREAEDPDAAFLFYWIAFNAAYADDSLGLAERETLQTFFQRLHDLDTAGAIYRAVWTTIPGPIRVFLDNPYVFAPFWQHHHGIPGKDDWAERFERARKAFHVALARKDTAAILAMLFDRLYVLRNQLVHGGATWNSSVNRDQLRDGVKILATIVPIVIDLMMANPHADWGRPHYPVVEG